MTFETTPLEHDVIGLLDELSQLQDELFTVLAEKRTRMAQGKNAPPVAPSEETLEKRELALCDRLRDCHERRAVLLRTAQQQGLPSDSIAELAPHLEAGKSGDLVNRVKNSSHRMRLLQHQSLTNWVVAQRSLLHVTQLLEIIASGGRLKPTYGSSGNAASHGSLVDQEAYRVWGAEGASIDRRITVRPVNDRIAPESTRLYAEINILHFSLTHHRVL